MLRSVIVAMLICSTSSRLIAQQFPHLDPGAGVRFATHDAWYEGNVLSQDAESLRVENGHTQARLSVPLAAITTLFVNRGARSSAGQGAKVGLGVGALTGGLFGGAAAAGCSGDFLCPPPLGTAVVGALVLGGAGALLGAVIGAAGHHEVWELLLLRPS